MRKFGDYFTRHAITQDVKEKEKSKKCVYKIIWYNEWFLGANDQFRNTNQCSSSASSISKRYTQKIRKHLSTNSIVKRVSYEYFIELLNREILWRTKKSYGWMKIALNVWNLVQPNGYWIKYEELFSENKINYTSKLRERIGRCEFPCVVSTTVLLAPPVTQIVDSCRTLLYLKCGNYHQILVCGNKFVTGYKYEFRTNSLQWYKRIHLWFHSYR